MTINVVVNKALTTQCSLQVQAILASVEIRKHFMANLASQIIGGLI